jgi:hypothetical protein
MLVVMSGKGVVEIPDVVDDGWLPYLKTKRGVLLIPYPRTTVSSAKC